MSNATGLAKIADTLSEKETAGRLRQLCERWIYSTCLCFALDLAEQEKSRFQYQYSVFQMEYSQNLWFRSGRQMDEIFQALIDRTRAPLDLDRIKTIFGDKNRPHRDTRKKNPTRWGVVVETPRYDLTVFKVHYGKMTLKIYTKGEHVLRIEVIVHNTKEYRWGRSLPCFGEIVVRLRSILERFLNAVGCLDACFVADETLENLPLPTKVGQTQVGGIDFNKPRMRRVAEAVLALSTSAEWVHGFRTGAEGASDERRSRICLRAAARCLRSQETAGQRSGAQDRILAPVRDRFERTTGHDRAGGPTRKGHQAVACSQPAARVTDQNAPSHIGRSPLRTSPGRHARSVHRAGDGRIRIANLFFIFSSKLLTWCRPCLTTLMGHNIPGLSND